MTKRKAKYGIQRGGNAIPLEGNIFMLNGKSHKQGGIDIDRTVEAQGGEIMRRFGPDNMQILSKEDNFIHGNPVKNYLSGMSFDDAFKLQQIDNVLQGRKNSINAKYGIETEYDRIKRTMSKKKTTSKSPSFGDRVRAASMLIKAATSESKKKLGNAARTIGKLADYVYSGEIADDAAKRVGIDTKGAAKKVISGVWSGLEQSPMGTGMRAVNDATSKIKDDDLRAMASVVPLLIGGGRMKSARRGAAGTGGGGRTARAIQGELKSTETPAKNKVTIKGVKPETKTTTSTPKNVTAPSVSKPIKKIKGTDREWKPTGYTDYRTLTSSDGFSITPKLAGDVMLFTGTDAGQVAAKTAGKYGPRVQLPKKTSYSDLDIWSNMSKPMRDALMGKPKEVTPGEIGSVRPKPRGKINTAARRGRDAALTPTSPTYEQPRRYYTSQTLSKMPATKGNIFDLVSMLESHKAEGASTANRPRIYQVMEKDGNIYETYGSPRSRRNRKKFYKTTEYIGNKYPEIVEPENGIMEPTIEGVLHDPRRIYEGMKSKAKKGKGGNTNATSTTTRQNATSETSTTTNNSSKVSTAKKWGKRIGYGAAGTAGVGLLVNAFAPRNKNAGFTNSDAYGVDENLSGRFVTVDPDERDIDTIGSIGEGMHNDTVLGKIYDANGDTTKLKQISDTTRQDTARRKKNKYGGVSSLRGVKSNRIKAPFGIDEWNNNYDWNLGYDGLPLVLYNNSAAYRKRLGYETPDVNVDHTNGTGNTSPRLSNMDIPWLSTSTTAASAESKTPVTPKATPMGVNTNNYKINYSKTNNNDGLFNDIDKRWNRHNNTQAIVSGIGSLASLIPTYLTYRNSIKNNPYNTSMMFEPYVKFNTYYNINPQISQLRESFGLANRNIRANTASSQNTLNRINNALNNMNSGINEQYAIKENKENESINKEIEFNAGVNQRNTSAYNDRTLEGAKYNAAAINGLYTGIGDFIQSLGDTYKNYSNNRMNYLKDNITARMILSKYYKPMAEQVVPEILKKYGVSPLVS